MSGAKVFFTHEETRLALCRRGLERGQSVPQSKQVVTVDFELKADFGTAAILKTIELTADGAQSLLELEQSLHFAIAALGVDRSGRKKLSQAPVSTAQKIDSRAFC